MGPILGEDQTMQLEGLMGLFWGVSLHIEMILGSLNCPFLGKKVIELLKCMIILRHFP